MIDPYNYEYQFVTETMLAKWQSANWLSFLIWFRKHWNLEDYYIGTFSLLTLLMACWQLPLWTTMPFQRSPVQSMPLITGETTWMPTLWSQTFSLPTLTRGKSAQACANQSPSVTFGLGGMAIATSRPSTRWQTGEPPSLMSFLVAGTVCKVGTKKWPLQ